MGSVNDNVWFRYAEGIQTWAGKDGGSAKPDPNAMYFIASAVNKGPAAGSFVPDTNMNFTLYQLCDALIANTSPVYNPGTQGSYFDNVYKYLRAVRLKESHDQGLDQQFKDAKEALVTAQGNYKTQSTNAFNDWSTDPRSGSASGTAFESWAAMNAPVLMAAQQERDNRAQAVAQLSEQIFGPDGAVLTQQQNGCLQASNRLSPVTGYNMKCSLDQIKPADYRKYYQALQNGTVDSLPPLPESPPFYLPAYSIDPTFKTTMDEWARVPIDAKEEFSWNINSSELKQSSWKKVGHEEGSAGISFGFIRIGGGESKDWSDSKVTTESGSFEIQLTAQRAGLFNVIPGIWNVKQFRVTYPKTDGDVGIAKNAIQPTQLFCASRVKLRVKFTGSMETAFDNAVNEVKGGKGGISILGFTVGGSAGRTENETTHTSDLVKQDGWYEIKPTLVAGGCSMLAVIGSKFDNPQ